MRTPGPTPAMETEFVRHATLRDAVGGETARVDLPAGATVGEAASRFADDHDGLRPLVFGSDGRIRATVRVLVGDEEARSAGPDRVLPEADTVTLAPGVAGGARTEAR